MYCHFDPHPAINATFSINTLDKSTRTADNAINRQPDIISIRKDTFNPVINFKGGVTNWAPGFPRLRMYTLVQAEWAGQILGFL